MPYTVSMLWAGVFFSFFWEEKKEEKIQCMRGCLVLFSYLPYISPFLYVRAEPDGSP